MPDESEFICKDWVWDSVLKELRHHPGKGKGHDEKADAAERLKPVRSVTWHRWSQAPMATPTGHAAPTTLSRVVAEYEEGGNLTLNEYDRSCAEKLAQAIAGAFGLEVTFAGAPGGSRPGNLPSRDEMGRLVNRSGRTEVVLDETKGEIAVTRGKRFVGKSRRIWRTTEVRRLELGYDVSSPVETFTVWALTGPEEEKLPLASYAGYEGWADPEEWRGFTRELAQKLGVEAVLPG